MSERFQVVTYDRRGFSRSQPTGPQIDDRRIETDADDVRRLIEHVGPGPATVFGASSGALIGLEVLSRHPSVVHQLVPYEPPAVTLLTDGDRWIEFFARTCDLYEEAGIEPAMEQFRQQAFAESDRWAMSRAPKSDATVANSRYWFEHELRQYPGVPLGLDALRACADRVVLDCRALQIQSFRGCRYSTGSRRRRSLPRLTPRLVSYRLPVMRSTPIVVGDPWVALGSGIRREVLVRVACQPRSVAEIARELPVSRPAVSQHLRVLADAGLVRCRTQGRRNIYEARLDGLGGVRAELERFWTQALANFKHVAEQSYEEDTSSE